ncbi:hypothetical protein LWI29_003180 [Acer saccharum]|uniref:Uncharacterized protein n=1 Tax=Acer saccharum TaxID=4024 RepID=A0AA39RBS2_ACESA|nr:hypothetical protein LWI29_003180 [Acer saccharum]
MKKRKTDDIDPKGKLVEVTPMRLDSTLVSFPARISDFNESCSFLKKSSDLLFPANEKYLRGKRSEEVIDTELFGFLWPLPDRYQFPHSGSRTVATTPGLLLISSQRFFRTVSTAAEQLQLLQRLYHYVDGTAPTPSTLLPTAATTDADTIAVPVPNPAYLKWFQQDQLIVSYLVSTLTEPMLSLIVGKTDALNMWTGLKDNFSQHSVANATNIRFRLMDMSKGTKTISAYLQHAKSLFDSLATINEPVLTTDLVTTILCGLGSNYGMIITAIFNFPPLPKFEDLRTRLLSYESQLLHTKPTDVNSTTALVTVQSPSPAANFTQTPSSGRGKHRGSGRGGRHGHSRGHGHAPWHSTSDWLWSWLLVAISCTQVSDSPSLYAVLELHHLGSMVPIEPLALPCIDQAPPCAAATPHVPAPAAAPPLPAPTAATPP